MRVGAIGPLGLEQIGERVVLASHVRVECVEALAEVVAQIGEFLRQALLIRREAAVHFAHLAAEQDVADLVEWRRLPGFAESAWPASVRLLTTRADRWW